MKMNKSTFLIFALITIFSIMPVTLLSQQDTLSVEQSGSNHSLFTGLGFGNNMMYMGTSISQDKPYYFGSITYGFKNEFFASVSTAHLSAFDPLLAFSTFNLNYSHTFYAWFDISMNLSRYQVNKTLSDTLFNSFFYGDLSLGLDWKILYSKLSVGGLISESSGLYFQLRNSRYFKTPEFINGKAFVSFDPYANMLFGSLTKTTTADGTTIAVTQPFHTGRGGGSGSGSSTTTIFGLMELDLGIPVAFNTNKITIEAEPGFVIPLYSTSDSLNPKGFVFLLSCYIRIF